MIEIAKLRSPCLYGLSCQRVNRTSGSHLKLVKYHVSQPLIIDHPKVDVRGEFFTCDTRIHWLVAIIVVPGSTELLAKIVDSSIGLRKSVARLRTRENYRLRKSRT